MIGSPHTFNALDVRLILYVTVMMLFVLAGVKLIIQISDSVKDGVVNLLALLGLIALFGIVSARHMAPQSLDGIFWGLLTICIALPIIVYFKIKYGKSKRTWEYQLLKSWAAATGGEFDGKTVIGNRDGRDFRLSFLPSFTSEYVVVPWAVVIELKMPVKEGFTKYLIETTSNYGGQGMPEVESSANSLIARWYASGAFRNPDPQKISTALSELCRICNEYVSINDS